MKNFQKVLAVVSKMPHIIKSGMDLDPRLAFRFMEKIKKAVKIGIWDGLCLDCRLKALLRYQ